MKPPINTLVACSLAQFAACDVQLPGTGLPECTTPFKIILFPSDCFINVYKAARGAGYVGLWWAHLLPLIYGRREIAPRDGYRFMCKLREAAGAPS